MILPHMGRTAADIPRQSGRVAVVTGATSGIGHHTARGRECRYHRWPVYSETKLANLLVGPGGLLEIRGQPKVVSASGRARDAEAARRLREASERLTGVTYL
jgi:hypothetical protein